jgi:uncharacterized protein (TIGR03435 family)
MAWTKAKTTVTVAAVFLLAAGTTTVSVEQIIQHRSYPWQSRSLSSGMLDQLPPQVHIVPTKFPHTTVSVSTKDKVLGIGYSLESILLIAYRESSSSRIVSSAKLPETKYDFIANLPQNSHEALQQELKKKFGLNASIQSRETDVLRLTVKNAAADGLRPSTSQNGSASSGSGKFSCADQPLSSLIPTLEDRLKVPVVDETGLTGRFDIDLSWDETDSQRESSESLKQALLEELGLELTPVKQPMDMLVVQQSRQNGGIQ